MGLQKRFTTAKEIAEKQHEAGRSLSLCGLLRLR